MYWGLGFLEARDDLLRVELEFEWLVDDGMPNRSGDHCWNMLSVMTGPLFRLETTGSFWNFPATVWISTLPADLTLFIFSSASFLLLPSVVIDASGCADVFGRPGPGRSAATASSRRWAILQWLQWYFWRRGDPSVKEPTLTSTVDLEGLEVIKNGPQNFGCKPRVFSFLTYTWVALLCQWCLCQ